MASRHVIGAFNFELWNGPPPLLVQEQVSTFHRVGADGVGFQTLGKHGQTFDVTLTYWDASYALCLAGLALMKAIVGTQVVVTYNDINYSTTFSHQYLVNAVEEISCDAVVRQIRSAPTPAINRTNAGELLVRFTLTPVDVS